MKNLISGILAVALVAGPASAQTPRVTTTLPSATVKLNGASGGGSGTGFVCDAGDMACVFQAPAGYEVEIDSDSTYLNDEAGNSIFGVTPTGTLTYVQAQLVGTAKELRDITTRSTTGTFTGTNILCSTGGGAVVGTLDADAATNGRFVYITRSGASTCTVAVESGHTLDGVTDGTTTVANGGSKTFKQSGDTAWITTTEYPVTGTLSGLTATKLPVATSATAVGDSAITHDSTTGVTTFGGSGPKLVLGTDALFKFNVGNGTVDLRNAADSAYGSFAANTLGATTGASLGFFAVFDDSVGIYDDGWDPLFGMRLKNGAVISWPNSGTPDTQIKRDAAGQVGVYGAGSTYGQLNVGTIQQSYSKALVDATATDVVQVPVASNSYEGFTMDYTIFATDATDYQVRQGSVPVAVLNVGGTETCVFGTATEAVNASAGTLTVAFDCTAGTNTVMVRANADTSLASTTVFTIQQRINLTSGTAVLVPQ